MCFISGNACAGLANIPRFAERVETVNYGQIAAALALSAGLSLVCVRLLLNISLRALHLQSLSNDTFNEPSSTGAVDVVLGAQWGDEGKGKLVDIVSPKYDICARVAGGSNAGHTIVVEVSD